MSEGYEVYEVCRRLKAAGFPQYGEFHSWEWRLSSWPGANEPTLVPVAAEDYGDPHNGEQYHAACPNASECMKFAREKWGDDWCQFNVHARLGLMHQKEPGIFVEFALREFAHRGQHATDLDQSVRLALAAALEADNAK